jgi:uncharacterized RDD family membrane protein YckC
MIKLESEECGYSSVLFPKKKKRKGETICGTIWIQAAMKV